MIYLEQMNTQDSYITLISIVDNVDNPFFKINSK